MPAKTISARLTRAIALVVCLLMLPAWRFGPAVSLFDEPQGIAEGMARISEAGGGLSRFLSIHIEPHEIHIEAQDPSNARHVNRWRLVRANALWVNWDRVGKSEPVQLDSIDKDLEASLFDLADVDLGAAERLIADALDRAALEDPGAVTSMEIRRQLYLMPRRTMGDVRWTVTVRSEREHARLVADPKGNIFRADLAGTNRARELNVFRQLDLVENAARAFEEEVGREPVLTEVNVSERGVSFKTNLPGPPLFGSIKQAQTYRWSMNGLETALGSADLSHHFGAKPPFAIGDVDWSSVKALPDRARAALEMPDAPLVGIDLQKPGDTAGEPTFEWRVSLLDAGSLERSVARFNAKGEVTGKTLPESQRKAFDGRDPDGWADALKAIEESFGRDGWFAELTLVEKHIRIYARDPQTPSRVQQFILNEGGVKRFGSMVSPFVLAKPRFYLEDLGKLTPERLRALREATAKRLGLETDNITTITIGKGSLDPSPQGNVTVEIRAEEAPFQRGGRVNWEIDGHEIKAYLP